MKYLPYLFAVPIMCAVFVLPMCFKSFTDLIGHMKEAHNAAWLKAGRPGPLGGLWRDPDCGFWSDFVSQWYALKWIFKTPQWCEEDEEARRLLHSYRFWVGAWNLGVMPLLIVTVIFTTYMRDAR